MLRILYDDFDQKVKNIHDEMDFHHSYKKKCVSRALSIFLKGPPYRGGSIVQTHGREIKNTLPRRCNNSLPPISTFDHVIMGEKLVKYWLRDWYSRLYRLTIRCGEFSCDVIILYFFTSTCVHTNKRNVLERKQFLFLEYFARKKNISR